MFSIGNFFTVVPDFILACCQGSNSPWDLLNNIEDMIKWIIANRGASLIKIDDDIYIGENTTIDTNVTIYGPAIIGSNCQIRSSAFIRENVLIGDNCVVGNSSEVKNSILLNQVEAPHFNYIGDSILGNYAHLGAGVILSNLRLDKKEIVIKHPTQGLIHTGRRKIGSIIGDCCEIGCNCVMNPGTILEKACMVYPLKNIGGYYLKNSVVR